MQENFRNGAVIETQELFPLLRTQQMLAGTMVDGILASLGLFYYPIKNKTKQNRKKRKRWHQLLQKLRSNPSLRVFSVFNWSGRRKTWEGGCFICGPQEMFSWERNRCKQEKRLNTVIVWMAHKPNRGNIVVLSNLFSLVFTPSLLTVVWHSLALFKSFVYT